MRPNSSTGMQVRKAGPIKKLCIKKKKDEPGEQYSVNWVPSLERGREKKNQSDSRGKGETRVNGKHIARGSHGLADGGKIRFNTGERD